MFQSQIGEEKFTITFDKNGKEGTINGADFNWDLLSVSKDRFHILHNHVSYLIAIEKRDLEARTITLKINGKRVVVSTKNKMDLLLESMGLSQSKNKKINEIKAPMPGLVLRAIAKEGDIVSKGDSLLVLEAMKMENVIKSPGDGIVSKILVEKGQAVDKNQILLVFQ
jgi:biotin carboxyl carrier protein